MAMSEWRKQAVEGWRKRVRECPWDLDAQQMVDVLLSDTYELQFQEYVFWSEENAVYGDASHGIGVTPAGDCYLAKNGFCYEVFPGIFWQFGRHTWECKPGEWVYVGERDEIVVEPLSGIEDIPGFDPENPQESVREFLRQVNEELPPPDNSGGVDG
jgi:hypothetical protein